MQDSENSDQENARQKKTSLAHDIITSQRRHILSMFDDIKRKLNGKSTLIMVGVGGGVLLLIGSVSVSYFAFMRVPDSEYTKASEIIQEMSLRAKDMSAFDKDFSNIYTSNSLDEKRIIASKEAADSYVNLLLKLQNSPVVKRDNEVKTAYARTMQPIDEYGSSTVSLLGTLTIYSTATKRCGDLSRRVDEPKTVAQFDALAAGCKEYVTAHKTVQIKEFNDEVYVKYRKATLDFVTAARKYYVASNSKNGSRSSVQRAMNTMDKAQTAMQKVGNGGYQYLKNTQNSIDQLSMLREVIEERRDVLLR